MRKEVTKSVSKDALSSRDWSAEWAHLPAAKLPGSRAAEGGKMTIRLSATALAEAAGQRIAASRNRAREAESGPPP
jgi:hypothetical protein